MPSTANQKKNARFLGSAAGQKNCPVHSRRPSRMVVLSDLHNSEFGAYNSELVDKVRQHRPVFTCASRWAMWKPDCAPAIWIPPIRRSSTGRRWACWQNITSRPPSRPSRTCCGMIAWRYREAIHKKREYQNNAQIKARTF